MTSDQFGEELVKKYGTNASSSQSNSSYIPLNVTNWEKNQVKDFIERRKLGKTYKPMKEIKTIAKNLFKELSVYDLFLNNCQHFAEKLDNRI